MKTKAIAWLCCFLLTIPAAANIEISDAAGSPLQFTNAAGIPGVLQVALGDMYTRLRGSSKTYRIVFRTSARIARALQVSEELAGTLGGYFEKDVNSRSRFFIFVNQDFIRRSVDKQVQEAQADLAQLSEEKRAAKILLLTRLMCLGIIAHEATHAVQAETGRVGFGRRLGTKEQHDKIAHDRYDEQEGYENQSRGVYRIRNILTDANARKAHEESISQANKDYSGIPAVFKIVRNGRAVDGEAPFAWPSSDAKTMASFVAEVVRGDLPAAAAGQGASGDRSGAKGSPSPASGEEQAAEDDDEASKEITDVGALESASTVDRKSSSRVLPEFAGSVDFDPTAITYPSPSELQGAKASGAR